MADTFLCKPINCVLCSSPRRVLRFYSALKTHCVLTRRATSSVGIKPRMRHCSCIALGLTTLCCLMACKHCRWGPLGYNYSTTARLDQRPPHPDRKSTRLNSSHVAISYAVCCLKEKT